MSPAAPMPKKVETTAVDDELDAVIDRIDACLPAIHAKVAKSRRSGDTPSEAFNMKRIAQTKAAFQQMAENPLLSESGEDIQLD